jgi:hypothetical protein
MASDSNSLIVREVDRLFAQLNAKRGECCDNPVTSGGFVWGIDPIAEQKEYAIVILLAREWFAVNGPPDAPPFPLSGADVEEYRNARGLKGVVGFYARSLSRLNYDVRNHPSFEDFARGLMAINTGLWGIEKDENLKKRFPPRPLVGMTRSAFWAPPEEYEELQKEYEKLQRRKAA